MVDFVRYWSGQSGLPTMLFVAWLEISRSKFYGWKSRYGRPNEHNGAMPRDHWREPWEEEAIVGFHDEYPLEGYRRLTFMMIDADIVAVSPSTTYRVLKKAGKIGRRPGKPSSKGKGFRQPKRPHQHWHIDIAYLNICGTFYSLCSILDGFSRAIVHWEIRETMKEAEVEMIIQRALERYPGVKPRIISDNGPQFVARDFKFFVRQVGLEHVRTSPYYPQSNGKLERYHRTVKADGIRPQTPLTLEDARRVVATFVQYYNEVRLHSAIGYVTPQAMLDGLRDQIHAERNRKLEEARQRRCNSCPEAA